MNARVERPPARKGCPTSTRRLLGEGASMVDVRESAEVAQLALGVPGVLLMPMSDLEQRLAEVPCDRDLVLVCQVGDHSLKATYILMYHGYTQVANMEGGIYKWAAKGFPIKGVQPSEAAAPAGCCGATAPAAASRCGTTAASPPEPAAGSACCNPAFRPRSGCKPRWRHEDRHRQCLRCVDGVGRGCCLRCRGA